MVLNGLEQREHISSFFSDKLLPPSCLVINSEIVTLPSGVNVSDTLMKNSLSSFASFIINSLKTSVFNLTNLLKKVKFLSNSCFVFLGSLLIVTVSLPFIK